MNINISELKLKTIQWIKKSPRLYFWYLLIRNLILEFNRDGCLHLAAGIAFFGMFSIFPILLIIISILGYRFGHTESLNQIMSLLQQHLPAQADLIINNVEVLAKDRSKLGIAGLLILLWTGRGLFLALEYSLNRAWGNPNFRSVIGRNLLAFFLILTMSIVLGLSVVMSASFVYLEQIKIPVIDFALNQLSFWSVINKWIISTTIVMIIFILLFKMLPHTKVSFKEILPGAIFATICWKAAEFGYIWYMKNMANLSAIYGSIGGLLGVLLLFYIAAIVFLLGAEFNIVYLRIKYKKELH